MKKSMNIFIIIGVALIIGVIYLLNKSTKTSGLTAKSKRPSEANLPQQLKSNDKLIIVENISAEELQQSINGFCSQYNQEAYQALPRATDLGNNRFAISFPYDIDFTIYCFFVNYMTYPTELKRTILATGWTAFKNEDNETVDAIVFVPESDTEYDNVYITTANNIGYKFSFANSKEKRLADYPPKTYVKRPFDLEGLESKTFTDFK